MFRATLSLAACLFVMTGALVAQSPSPGKPTTTDAPSPAITAPLTIDDLDTLRAHLTETVDVRGTPTGTGHSKAGTVTYLNFGPAHKALSVVAFLGSHDAGDPASRKVQSEDDLKPFVGKAIIVHGKVADYKGDLQIVLDSLDQIKLAP